MARRPMSEEERAAKAEEHAIQQATKNKYSRKTNITQVTMEENVKTEGAASDTGDTGNGTINDTANQTQNNGAGGTGDGNNSTTPEIKPAETTTKPVIDDTSTAFGHLKPQKTFNPFKKNAVERAYSTPVIKTEGNVEPLRESVFDLKIDEKAIEATAKNAGNVLPVQNGNGTTNQQQQAVATVSETPIVGTNNLSPEEQLIASTQLADMILSGYAKLHEFARYIIKVDEADLQKKSLEDKLPMDLKVPIDVDEDGRVIQTTLMQFTKEFNKDVDKEFILSEDFKSSVRPAMIRLFVKNKWGIKDEYWVAYKFGEDLATKFAMAAGFKSAMNKFYSLVELQHEELKKIAAGTAVAV